MNHFYASHTFADKKLHRPLHAADLFAWEATNAAACAFTRKGFTRKKKMELVQSMRCERTLMGRKELEMMAPAYAAVALRPPHFNAS